jgi:hypothetical protein
MNSYLSIGCADLSALTDDSSAVVNHGFLYEASDRSPLHFDVSSRGPSSGPSIRSIELQEYSIECQKERIA